MMIPFVVLEANETTRDLFNTEAVTNPLLDFTADDHNGSKYR